VKSDTENMFAVHHTCSNRIFSYDPCW